MSESRQYHVAELTTEEPGKGVNIRMIVSVGAISLIVFLFSALVAYKILVVFEHDIAAEGVPNATPLLGNNEIGIVDFVHYDEDTRLPTWRAQIKEKLNGYSWADKAAGRVRLPIEEGMKKAMAEAAAGTAIGADNAVVASEPDVPRLKLKELIANPAGKPPGVGPIGGSPATPLVAPGAAVGGDKDPKPPGGGTK